MTHFNKRHYQDLALVMQNTYPTFLADQEQWNITRTALADMFAKDNSLFKYDLFIQACIPGNNVRARKVA